jgi:hypothetical protein
MGSPSSRDWGKMEITGKPQDEALRKLPKIIFKINFVKDGNFLTNRY